MGLLDGNNGGDAERYVAGAPLYARQCLALLMRSKTL